MTSPVKNQVYTAEILGYSSEGLGIARIGGQVVFVHDAIAGEVCDILVMKVLKKPPLARWWHGKPSLPTAGSRIAPSIAAAAAAPTATWTTPRSCGPKSIGCRTP